MLAAVIVTYNRKELLGNNIRMLLKQTLAFDRIFIVHMTTWSSRDG